MQKNTIIKILVTDYDNTAFTMDGTHPAMLSPALLEYAKHHDYTAFYGCTHRRYTSLIAYKDYLDKEQSDEGKRLRACFFTHQITENFSRETNLSCLAVSTLDDVKYQECGVGYQKIIKPFESDHAIPDENSLYLRLEESMKYESSKNIQLQQIAQDVIRRFPGANIQLDYVDDRTDLLQSALNATYRSGWPSQVKLNLYHHNADQMTPVVFIDRAPTYTSINQSSFVGFFKSKGKQTESILIQSQNTIDISGQNRL